MTLSTDAKVGIGILAATLLIIFGGAWYASRTASDSGPAIQPATNPERIVQPHSARVGPEKAAVTVVEFGDFQCPACGAFYPLFQQLKEQNKDSDVAFVFRHFPLEQHEHAALAAEAATAAQAQGKFWEYHDLLFENQTNLEREDLESYAEEVELDMDRFRRELDEHTHAKTVNEDIADGRAVGVSGTPTIFINEARYTGPYSLDALQQAIDNARQG